MNGEATTGITDNRIIPTSREEDKDEQVIHDLYDSTGETIPFSRKIIIMQTETELIKIIPIGGIILFILFASIALLSGVFLLLSALKGILFLDPYYLLFIFFGAIGLALTSWKGITSQDSLEENK